MVFKTRTNRRLSPKHKMRLISSQEAEKLHLETALSLKTLVYGDVSNFP